MHNIQPEDINCKILDHLGLVADTIDELDIISHIDKALPVSLNKGAKTTMGERVAAMIFNGLGFIDNRLYLFPEFLKSKAVNRIFARDVKAEYFNDDVLGRCLDEISDYGVTKLFTEMSFAIGTKKGLLGTSAHFDTTTLQVWGEYDTNAKDDSPHPARGYSKNGRHDLKQMVLNLATTGKSAFPVWMEAHSGNASDKTVLPNAAKQMKQLCNSLKGSPEFLYVGDSAIYSNVLKYPELKWLSRVPVSIKEAKDLVQSNNDTLSWLPLTDGYFYHVTTSNYGEIEQRWVLIYSEHAYKRENKTLDKRIATENKQQSKDWWHLSNQEFSCIKDAEKSIKLQKKKLKYHSVYTNVIPITVHAKKGRPAADAKKIIKGYKIEFQLERDELLIAKRRIEKGRFVLATNELDESTLPSMDILKEYKAQSGTEKSFKFIKNNSFEVDSIFLKKDSRIEALMMIMTLCLMVYGVAEYNVRTKLVAANETIPNPGGKPTNKPSLQRVFQLFLGIQEVEISLGVVTKHVVANITEVVRKVLGCFGNRAREIYLSSA